MSLLFPLCTRISVLAPLSHTPPSFSLILVTLELGNHKNTNFYDISEQQWSYMTQRKKVYQVLIETQCLIDTFIGFAIKGL